MNLRAGIPAASLALALSVLPALAEGPDGQFVTQAFVASGEFEAHHIEDRQQVSIIELVGNYDKEKPDGELNLEPRTVIAREFFRTHPDEYDFLVVFTTFEFATPSSTPGLDALAFHLGVRNDVEGIGLPIFDNSEFFGSDGRLLGYVDMAALSRYETDSLNPRFELVLGTLAHEIQHQWCCYVEFRRPDGSTSLDLLGSDDAHWSYLLDTDASVMYGHEWRDNGNGSFTAVDARRFFSPLDLYLAGFLTPDEVEPFLLIDQPGGDRTRLPERGVTIQGSRSTVSLEDVVSAEGPRLPSASSSPKKFRAAFLVVTRPGTRPSDELLARVNQVRTAFQTRFSILTAGRAVAQVFPEAMVDGSVGTPDGVEGGALRDDASLADGFTWLRNQQRTEGFWEDTEATRLRDTTVSLETLLRFDDAFAGSSSAIGWLRGQEDRSVDFLARRAASLERLGVDAAEVRAKLLALQNADGGFGIAEGYGSDPLDTALAILALADRPLVPEAAVGKAVQYLIATRNADGAWGHLHHGASRTRATTTAVRALVAAGRLDPLTDAALPWLASKQNGDGGFGDSPSTVHDTADVLMAFADLDESGRIRSEDAYLYLKSQQSLDGSWSGSAFSTALALTALQGGTFPNLRFGAPITAVPASPRDGERVELSLSVVNDGGSPSLPVLLRLFEGDPDDGGLPLAPDVGIPALPANRSATVRVSWDSFDKPGLRKIFAVLDADGALLELSELDNESSIEIDVQPAPDGADLEIRSGDVAIVPVAPDRLPTTLAISAGLRNLGRTGVGAARVRLWLGPAGTGTLLDEQTTPILERSTRVVNFSYALSVSGTTLFTIEADPENELPEENEENNVAASSVTTTPSVDLVVTNSDLSLESGTPFLGNDVTFRARIRNAGTVDAPPALARFSITDGTTTDILANRSLVLGAGETVEQTLDYRIDRVGELRLVVELDPVGVVPEADETNNVGLLAFTASELDSANLAVSHKDIVFEPVPGLEGSPFRVAALVRNVGVAPATDVEVGFYHGDPDQGGSLMGALQTVSDLAPGTGAVVEVVLPSPPGVGERLVFAVVDPANRIAEFDEADNRAFESILVLRLPDLATSSGALELSPRFPRAGEAVTLTVQVTNLGEQPSASVTVRAFEGDPSSGGAPVGGDQALSALAPGATGAASFSWSLDAGPARPIVVVVDPDGLGVESTRANNTARIDVAVQDSDFYVTHRYFSPNGDGVQDTTRFFYRLGAEEVATVEVMDRRGRVVRRSPPIAAQASDFEWDGLDDLGRLARDGDYRLQVVRGAEVLGQALVTLDTDRSSLIEALGTPLELASNLTCDVTYPGRPTMSGDERWVYFPVSFDPLYPDGIYRVSSLGGDIQRILELDPWSDIAVAPDASHIAFSVIRQVGSFYRYELWVANGDGTSPRALRSETSYVFYRPLGFIEDGRTLLAARESGRDFKLEAFPLDGSDVRTVLSATIYSVGPYALSPRETHLLMGVYDGSGSTLRLVNLKTGTTLTLPWSERFAWSPDGARFATTDRDSESVVIRDEAGNVRRNVPIPVEPIPPELLPPDATFDFDGLELQFFRSLSWSASGTELALIADYSSYQVTFGRLFRIDAVSGEVETIGWTEPQFNEGEEDGDGESYHVSAWDGGSFVEKGVLHYGLHYQDQELALSLDERDSSGEVRIFLRQTGREAAHVDFVALRSGEREVPPVGAIREADGKDVLAEVRARDSEVLDLHETSLGLVFERVPPGPVKLVLRAREETLTGRNARPFVYPGASGRHFDVALHPSTPMRVDGMQTGEDDLGDPLFEERSRPGTGHPSAWVSGFAKSDGRNLYAALDFTVDNTQDGERDWAALLVRSGESWREFRVTAQDSRWGVAGFTRTGRAQYNHKYYEFKIPLSEIGSGAGEVVQLRFEAYGTAAILDSNPELLPSFGEVLWAPNDRTLLYTSNYPARVSEAIFLDEDNRREVVLDNFDFLFQPHFSPSGRRLQFDASSGDPFDPCSLDGSSDFWSLSSLANLTADLRARRISLGGGIRLDGTAADRNFSHYTLEYAPGSNPGAFTLIQPASSQTAIDGFLTTWVPPSTGSFFVRLTATDLAGNSRSTIRRVSYSDFPSITDVYRTPVYISPNGDGIQDELLVHYRVLEPVHLEFHVVNEAGDRLRTIQRDHAVAGEEFTLAWNGADDRGLPVRDGEYRLLVQGYEFFFHIDTRVPEVELRLIDAYQPLELEDQPPIVIVNPRLEWCIEEENLKDALFETGEGADPTSWSELREADPVCLDQIDEAQRFGFGRFEKLSDFVDHRFRLEATDRAGNRSRAATGLGREELIVHGFGLPNSADVLPAMPFVSMEVDTGEGALFQLSAGDLRIRVAETLRAEIVEVAIQYRPLEQTFWQETRVEEFLDFSVPKVRSSSPPELRFDIPWNLAGVPLGVVTAVRLRAVDLDGRTFFSNSFQVQTDGVVYGGYILPDNPPAPPPEPDIVHQLAAEAVRDELIVAKEQALWAIEAVPEPLAEIKLFIRSDDDPRFLSWKSIDPMKVVDGAFLFRFDGTPCVAYDTFVRVRTEPTRLADGRIQVRTIETDHVTLSIACLAVRAEVAPVPAESCSAARPQQLVLKVFPTMDAFSPPLQLLVVGEPLPDGEIDVRFNVNHPSANFFGHPETFFYPFVLDISDREEGNYPFVARLTNIDGAEASFPFQVLVDHTPPVGQILVPVENQKVCGIPRETEDGIRNVFDVEGVVEDEAGALYRLRQTMADGREKDLVFEETKGYGIHEAHGLLGTYGDEKDEPPFAGETTFRLEVSDWGGFLECTERTFFFDGEVEDADSATDRALFSPNGDGNLDFIELDVRASENFFATVDVHAAIEIKPGQFEITEPSLRRLASNLPVPNEAVLAWDGLKDDGVVAADGLYGIVVSFRDACGNLASSTRYVIVDNTPPVAEIHYPRTGDPLGLIAEVRGTTGDLHFAGYGVEFGIGPDPSTWARFGAGRSPRVDEILASWNTRGLEGDVTLRLVASDHAGNQAEASVPLLFETRVDLLSYFEAVPALFSPNGDGRREETGLRFGLLVPSQVTLSIKDAAGSPITTLSSAESLQEGAFIRTWDGRKQDGTEAPDGPYTVEILAALTANPGVTQREKLTVIVDRTPPAVSLTRPADGFAAASESVVGSIEDLHLEEYLVSIAETPSAPVWTSLSQGTSNRRDAALASLAGLEEGDYALRVEASDEAENRTDLLVSFIIDATPPRVSLTSPLSGSVIGGTAVGAPVSGSVEEEHLEVYRLELGAGESPSSWTPIASGTSLPLPDPAGHLDLTALADGHYTLRLFARDKAGLSGEARILLDVDKTPPTVAITVPLEGAFLNAPVSILGTATDEHFVEYRLSLAPGGKGESSSFSEIGLGVAAVTDGLLLDWNALPADGLYTLRLRARDVVGLASEALVEVEVDTTPPAAPLNLTASVEDRRNGRLLWNANTEPDLAGYRVYRGGELITSDLVAAPTYLDLDLDEGRYIYKVTAVDQGGLESEPSNEASIAVDFTPPEARIFVPRDASRVSGLVDVTGTAYSQDDFKSYRLRVTGASGSTLLRESPVPIQADVLAQWTTVGLPEDAAFTLRLEAEDTSGNVAFHEVSVVIDNLPPAAPTGLTAVQQGTTSDVLASWNPNTEPDLLGYLLYRDGRLANATGVVIGDLKRFVLETTEYLDPGVPDGLHVYEVYAMDEAGNISDPSSPAEVTLDTRAPHAVIVLPADGTAFDATLHIIAVTEDTDVAEVRFQFRAASEPTWTDIGGPDTALPWETDWNPSGLDYGPYQLRAVATDEGGRTDPDPTPIGVDYRDVTRPAVVLNLDARVEEADVHLVWEAASDADLAGYHIDRRDDLGTEVRITAAPIAETSYIDSGLDEGTYVYKVVAVDESDNEGDPSNDAEAVVYTPLLEQPYTPTPELSFALRGSGAALAAVEGTLSRPSGASALPEIITDTDGNFAYTGLGLERGANSVTLRLRDTDDNLSKPASLTVVSGELPSAPVGLVAETTGGFDVFLTWTENLPAENVIGYRVFRNGEAALADTEVSFSNAAASTFFTSPGNAIDSDPTSYWAPELGSPIGGEWLEAEVDETAIASGLLVQWWVAWWDPGVVYAAADYDVEGWSAAAGAWIRLAEIRGNSEAENRVVFSRPYRTDRIRVVLRSALQPDPYEPVRLAELELIDRPLHTAPPYEETVSDGRYTYTVSALNSFGFEGPQSAPAELPVGDVEPPSPPVLSAAVVSSDVNLSWTPSLPDAVRYDLYRDSDLIAEHDDLANLEYLDASRPNGVYRYVVRGVDAAGNESAPSNEVEVTVSVAPPAAPIDLVVTEVPEGRALDLAWAPGVGPPPDSYRVLRATTSGGPYDEVGSTESTSLRDRGLENGVTYFYVVVGLDAIGNVGANSNEASGTPRDVTPPARPVLHYPGFPGTPFRTREESTLVAGLSEPGASVRLFAGGSAKGSTRALSGPLTAVAPVLTFDPQLSPTGRYVLDSSESRLFDFEQGISGPVLPVQGPARWSADGEELWIARDEEIFVYRLSDQSLEEVLTVDFAYAVVPSPDGRFLALLAYQGGSQGLLLVDRETSSTTVLVDFEPAWFEGRSLQWSPSSSHLVYRRYNPDLFEAVDVATGETILVETEIGGSSPSWSPDGESLVFTTYRDGFEQVWRYDLEAGVASPVTIEPQNHGSAGWAPDGGRITYVVDGRVLSRDVSTGEESVLFEGEPGTFPQLSWSRGGDLLMQHNGRAVRLRPAGRFELRSVTLAPGDNVFTATARDESGIESAPSDPMVVVLEAFDRPDLDVSLSVLPAAVRVGSDVGVTVAVRNVGGTPASPVELSVVAAGPGGFHSTLAERRPLGELAPGALRAVYFALSLDGPAGIYRFSAAADPLELISEQSESNNVAERQVVAVEGELPSLAVATDRPTYRNDEIVLVSAELSHAGDPFDGRLAVTIEDGEGFEVEPLFNRAVEGLGFGEIRTESADWNTGVTFAGDYRVRARLVDLQGALVAESFAPFRIVSSSALTGTVGTDRGSYLLGSTARIEGVVRYGTGNAVLRGLVGRLRVVDAGGGVLREWSRPLGDLLPGGESRIQANWETSSGGTGTFRAELAVLESTSDLAPAFSSFEVTLSPLALSGRLTLSDSTPSAGSSFTASYLLSNGGSSDLFDLPVLLRVFHPSSAQVVAEHELRIDLASGASTSGSNDFSTAGLALEPYFVALLAQLPGDPQATKLHDASFVPVDETPPRVQILAPAEGLIDDGVLDALVSAVDDLSAVRGVEVSLDEGEWLLTTPANLVLGHYLRAFSLTVEGEHRLRARASDAWENTAETGPVRFIVDRTPPLIVITGVQDGETYHAPVTPLVEVTDAHPKTETVTLNGDPFVSGTKVSAVGAYVLEVEAEDAAGNRSERAVAFEIEGTPSLEATKVDDLVEDGNGDGKAGAGDVVAYVIEIRNGGDGAATEVILVDPLPEQTTLVPGSISTTAGVVESESPLRVALGELAPSAVATIRFEVRVDDPLPIQVDFLSNQGVISSAELSDLPTDDPDTADASDPTRTPVAHEADWIFTDETGVSGVGTPGIKTGGLAWCDFNEDGYPDLLVNGGSAEDAGRSYLYFNQGDGTFRDVTGTHAKGLVRTRAHRSAVCGDLDNDGDLDFARNEHGRIEIYKNRGREASPPWSFGKTVDDKPQSPNQLIKSISGGMNTEGMGLLDFDNDGDLDLVVDNHDFGIDLFKNDGSGKLQHATPNSNPRGFPVKAKTGDYLAVADYDGNGFVDVLDRKEKQYDLWRNLGNGTVQANTTFEEEASNADKGGAAFCDLDSDGDFDALWTDAGVTQIWRNDAGTFQPAGEPGASSGIDLSLHDIDDVACADVDNDSDLDLYLSAASGASFLFFNETVPGSASPFLFVRDNRNIDVDANGEATAFADYDRDGDLDLVVNVDGASNQLWESHRSEAGANDYLAVRALRCMEEDDCDDDDHDDDDHDGDHDDDDDDGDDDDDDHNGARVFRDDIGATIRLLDANGLVALGPIREVSGGRGHGTQDPAVVHFGLPLGSDHRYVVEVRFIGGDGRPGRTVRREIVPSEMSGYRLLEITSCEGLNRPPVARDVEVETRIGREVEVRLRATDPDGDALEHIIVTPPRHGQLTGTAPTLRYQPEPGFEGEDRFTYKAFDGQAESNTAKVEIEVECDDDDHDHDHDDDRRKP